MNNIKQNIGKLVLALSLPLFGGVGGGLCSCADMLDPESDLVTYPEDHRLDTPNDTLSSVIGVIHLMQKVADRTNILGEVRADLSALTVDASVDLQELASFKVSDKNAYNQPQDYYAIVNNCNYYIQNVDSTYSKQGVKIFERELAVMHTFRAWAYLQLCLNYGDIPFYTTFLDTQLEADEILSQPLKGIKEVCEWLISDLQPWQAVKPLAYEGTFSRHEISDYCIPTRLMLGELCLWAGRYKEAAQYYHDFLADVNNPRVVYYNSARWSWDPGTALPSEKDVYSSDLFRVSAITSIPMESSSFYGTISQLRNIYCSTQDNNYYYEVTCSESAIEQSAVQTYYKQYVLDETLKRDTIQIDQDSVLANITDRKCYGDLRLASMINLRNNSAAADNDKYSKTSMSNAKFDDVSDQITLYREHIIYLHFAEALNRAGFPTAAFAVLKYGLYEELNEIAEGDPISADERAKAGSILDFPRAYFTHSNTMGIHSRGSGDAIVNPEYIIPSLATANDTMLWVEDRVIEELGLETIFEGHRYYDLMRVALRRDDNTYLADRVSKRNGKNNQDAALYGLLTNRMNWYLPMKK